MASRSAPSSNACSHTGQPSGRMNCGKTASMRSEEQTSELQSLMRISYDVFCLKKKKTIKSKKKHSKKTDHEKRKTSNTTHNKTKTHKVYKTHATDHTTNIHRYYNKSRRCTTNTRTKLTE